MYLIFWSGGGLYCSRKRSTDTILTYKNDADSLSPAISRGPPRDRLRRLNDIGSARGGELTRFAEVGIARAKLVCAQMLQ